MSKFAWEDFHGMGRGKSGIQPTISVDETVEAETFEEAFFKMTGLQPEFGDGETIVSGTGPFIKHLGNQSEQLFLTIAKIA